MHKYRLKNEGNEAHSVKLSRALRTRHKNTSDLEQAIAETKGVQCTTDVQFS